jgi:regulator-associated protein of mTOR
MRGQLNWIFIAVTDTIAWDVLSTDMFKRIFRNDLLAAALFRNFLLAVRRRFACLLPGSYRSL